MLGDQVILHLRAGGPKATVAEMRRWASIFTRFCAVNKQPAAIVQSALDPLNYYILHTGVAKGLDRNFFSLRFQHSTSGPVPVDARQLDTRIPRPRSSFMLYRTWMAGKIAAENPGLTGGCIPQIVSNLWRSESRSTRAHFKALADEEQQRHGNRRQPRLPRQSAAAPIP
ncbi:hypothetical protein QBC34DRAFT_428605 [Podospora aff. communis PSN243]|uniref:HMG box domain-containing protein n=1 Tax=Podospora aff. communis PSN243 TaxID=3040156 RepID=A0AAV9GCP3_9PEZI|nr:hypothetical protein QBC34DRAFT_428605 [Podospora aff. communis PSN243]